MKQRIIAIILAIFMVIGLVPAASLQAQDGFEGEGAFPGKTGPRAADERATKDDEKLWPAIGNERQIFKHVSAGWTDDDARITAMMYDSTDSDGSINVKVTHSGVTYSTSWRALFPEYYWNFIQDGQGWSYVAMRFEKDLYDAIDFNRSYITCDGGTVYFNDTSMSQKDLPRVINGVAHVKAFAYEDVFGYMNRYQTRTAYLKLVLKKGAKLEVGRQYRMEHRVLRKASDTDNILIREWVTGVDGRSDQFANSRHKYSQSTYVTPIAYGVPPKEEKYLTKNDSNQYDTILGSMMDMEVDWGEGLLTVRYYFDTNDMDHPNNQFVELMPIRLRDCLVKDAYGNVAYHSYLNRFGRVNNYNNNGPNAYNYDPVPIRMENFTWNEKKGLGGIRFRNDRYAGQDGKYGFNNSDYAWVKPWDYTWNYRPFYWRGTSMAPVQNVIVYKIDPYKLLETFGGKLEDLKFSAFFIGPKDGKLIPRSNNNVNGIVFPRTEVNPTVDEPIFTDSEEFTGKTNLNKDGHKVQVTVTDSKDHAAEVLSNLDTGKFTFNNNTTNKERLDKLKSDLRKGDIITFKNMDLTAAYGASSGTKVKVKARVRFRDNEEKTGPNNTKYYDPIFLENGVEKNYILVDDEDTLTKLPTLPKETERKGYEIIGWTKKPLVDAKDYEALPELTDAKQWLDDNNYKFTINSKLDRSQIVYAVWKKTQDGIKIVLHDNKGTNTDTETPVELTFEEAVALPDFETLTGKACPDFDKQVNYATEVNPDSLLPNAYTFDDTETNKDAKTIFTEKVDGTGRHYTLVGWSTKADNGDEFVEDLFNNRAILSKKTEGETTKYYLTTVATKAVTDNTKPLPVGQASAARKTKLLEPDENGVVNLYAAWKPYYDVKVTKKWYDGRQRSDKTIRDKFDNIVHGDKTYTKSLDPQGDIKVGLIRRTAVTEASSPTVTPNANYYTVPGSLTELKIGGAAINWQVPGFDNYGKRYSYVAIEFNPEEAEARYNGFSQRWSNIWTEVFDNVGDKLGQGSKWTDTTITKIQSLALKNNSGGVDAYSGATIRRLEGDDRGLESKVNVLGTYDITLYNIKVNIEAPAILDVFDGDNYFYFKEYDKDFVMKIELPEIRQDVYMLYNKTNKTWERVDVDSNNKITHSDKKNISIVEENLGNELDASGHSVPVNVWKLNYLDDKGNASSDLVFRRGQKITAQYYQFNTVGQERSLTSTASEVTAKIVKDKPTTPTLRDLTQARKEGNNIIVTANAPVADLGQFTQGAKIYLADPETGKRILKATGKLEEAGPYTDDDFILAERSGGIYVFKIPEKIVKHGDLFTALNTDVNRKDSLTGVPVRIDIEAPVVTSTDKTAFIGEDFRFDNVITTDEDANVQFDKLPEGAVVENPSSEKVLYKAWTVKGNVTDSKLYNIKLNVEDRFGNAKTAEWKFEVKERSESNAGFEAKQAKNDPKTNIDITKGVNGANIKVYLVDPAKNHDASPIAVSGVVDGKAKIYIEDQYIPKIKANESKIYLIQEEEGKKPSSPTKELTLDITPPAVPSPSAEPRSSIVHLTYPSNEVEEVTILVEGTSKTIRKGTQGKWVDERGKVLTDNGKGLDVEFDQKKFNPDKEIVVTARDEYANEASVKGYVGSAQAPSVEIKGKAYNGTDTVITTVENTEKLEDIHQVYVYKPVLENGKAKEIKKEVEETVKDGEEYKVVKKPIISYEKEGQPIGRAEVDANGNFKVTLSPQLPVGTDLLLVPVRYEVEGEPTKVTVIADKNGNGIDDALEPFNPETVKSMEVKDPTKMKYPKVNDTSDMKLKLEGMEVTLIDELGKKALVSYGQDGAPTVKSVEGPQDKQEAAKTALTNKLANLTTAPAKDAVLTVEANDKKPIIITYKVKEGEEVKGQTTPIRVFNDKNKNGIPDDEEGFDWNNLDSNGTKVDNWPKMEYKDKEAMDLSGLIVTLKDTTGKVKTLAYGKAKNGAIKDDFKDEDVAVAPANGLKLSAENAPEGHNKANIVLTLNKNTDKKTITLNEKALKVIYDSDGNGRDDREEFTKLEDVKALNRGDMTSYTVVTGKSDPGATVTIGTERTTAKDNGEFKLIIPKIATGEEITVKAQVGKKQAKEETVKVKEDKNNNGIPDDLESKDLAIKNGKARNIGENSQTLVSGETKAKTKVEITTEDGKTYTATVGEDGKFFTGIPHQKDDSKVKVKTIYEGPHGTEVGPEVTLTVYPDYNDDGVDDRLVPKFDDVVEGDKTVKVDAKSVTKETTKVEIKVGNDTKTFEKGEYGWNETGKSGQDIRPDANGKLPFPVDSTKVVTGAEVTVTLYRDKVKGSATKNVLGKVFTDAKVEPIKDGDETVVISEIPEGVTEITITDKAGNEKTITKDGDKWMDGTTELTPDNGKITVPKSDDQSFKEGDVVKVTLKDPKAPNRNHDQFISVGAKDKSTKPENVKALNKGENPENTTVTGKVDPKATVKILDENGKDITPADIKVNPDGTFTAEINPKKNDGDKIQVIATEPGKGPSDPIDAVVKTDKDGNGIADNEENFDIAKAAKIELVANPTKMDYLVTKQDGTVKFEAAGLLVRVTDKAGKEKLYNAEQIKAEQKFAIEPADNSDLTIAANNDKKVKVTLNVQGLTPNSVETTRALTVKLDANGNGIADDQEKFDISSAIKVEIISNPTKMDYLVTTKDGKAKFDTTGLVIRLTDSNGKTVNYAADELEKADIKDKITLSPANGAEIGLTPEGKTNNIDFTVTVNGAKADPKPSVTADKKVTVKLDANGDGIADEDQATTAPKDVKALNKGENPTSTTVTGKVTPGSEVKILDKDGKDITPADITVNPDGTFTAEVKPAKKDGDKIKVVATEPGKKASEPVEAVVKTDKDGDGIADTEQDFDIKKAAKIEMVRDPNKMDYLVRTQDAKVPFKIYGMLVKVTDKAGKEKLYNAEQIADDKTNFKVAPANEEEIGLDKNGQKVKVTLLNAPQDMTVKEVETSKALSVKLDANGNGIADEDEIFDIAKTKSVRILEEPTKMAYEIDKKDVTTKFETAGLVIELTDVTGKTVKYTASELNALTNKINIEPANGKEIGLAQNNTKLKVTVTSATGTEKPTVESTKAITVEIKAPTAPVVDPIKSGDDKVVVEKPAIGDEVLVTLPDGTKVVAKKDKTDPTNPDKWTASEVDDQDQPKPGTEKEVPVNNGKLEIPVDKDKVTEGEVKVAVKDNDSMKSTEVVVKIEKQLEQIMLSVRNLYAGKKGIVVTTNPGEAEIIIYKGDEVVAKGYTDGLGKATIAVSENMISGETYLIVASKNGYIDNRIVMTVN